MSLNTEKTCAVLGEIVDERVRQHAKWGEQNHPNGTGYKHQIMSASLARERCDDAAKAGRVKWSDILCEEFWEAVSEKAPAKLRAELIQVAAVAVAWVEAIDRRCAGD